jgi:nicotinamide riboside kinase
VSSPSDNESPRTLANHSGQQLKSLLRTASNRLEMLLNPDTPHHDDDDERLRIQGLDAVQRSALQRDAMKTINDVRAEFRRRDSV